MWPLADAWAAYAEVVAGQAEKVLPRLDPATTPPLLKPIVQLWRADACLQLGRLREARALAAEATETGRHRGELSYEGWGEFVLGEIDAKSAALALARAHGFRPLEALARLGLGRTYTRAGRRDAARREVEAAHALLTELGMTRWILAAEASRP